jgi:hypothetical protein
MRVAGELLEVTGPLDETELEYRRAAAIFPDPASMMALAGVARRRGHTDDECAFLAKTVDLLRGRPILPLQLLADAEMRAGHPEEALDAIDRRWLWADTRPGCGTSRSCGCGCHGKGRAPAMIRGALSSRAAASGRPKSSGPVEWEHLPGRAVNP